METILGSFGWSTGVGWVLSRVALIVLLYVAARMIRMAFRRAAPEIIKAAAVKSARGDAEEVTKRYTTLAGVVIKTFEAVIWVFLVLMLLSLLGLDIAPVLAGVGVAGIAIGFGAQTLVKDIISGVFILLENQYGKGDIVKLSGIAGRVEDVNLRRTVLRDLDGTVHNIPNGEVRIASNRTRDWSRVNLDVRVSYDEDLDQVFAVIARVGEALAADAVLGPLIIDAPKPLRVEAFEEGGITIKITGTTKASRQWEVTGELRKRLKAAFDAEGIEMSRPHRVTPA